MNRRKVSYATIKDVAELAETSVATVSYILSGKSEKSFRQDTVDRVMAAVEELNYSKNAIASGLRGNKRGMIYIIIPQFSNIYYTRVCEAIENVRVENGLVPVICDTREDPEREKRLLELAISQRCDGIVLGPTIRGWENTAAVRSLNIPLVVVGRELGSPNDQKSYYYVGDDSYQAGYLAGSVLAKGGHESIGVIDWGSQIGSAIDRSNGFTAAIKKHCPGVKLMHASSMIVDVDTGYQLTKRIFGDKMPNALFYSYHVLAQGGITYLHERGLRIPEDVTISMVGTPSWAKLLESPCTMVNQNEDWVGSTAAKIMLRLIDGDTSSLLMSEYRHVCRCQLVEHSGFRKAASN